MHTLTSEFSDRETLETLLGAQHARKGNLAGLQQGNNRISQHRAIGVTLRKRKSHIYIYNIEYIYISTPVWHALIQIRLSVYMHTVCLITVR